jgi:hypothetical protein
MRPKHFILKWSTNISRRIAMFNDCQTLELNGNICQSPRSMPGTSVPTAPTLGHLCVTHISKYLLCCSISVVTANIEVLAVREHVTKGRRRTLATDIQYNDFRPALAKGCEVCEQCRLCIACVRPHCMPVSYRERENAHACAVRPCDGQQLGEHACETESRASLRGESLSMSRENETFVLPACVPARGCKNKPSCRN